MNLLILGNFDYHDETILYPIFDALIKHKESTNNQNFEEVLWYYDERNKDCHIESNLTTTIDYWMGMVAFCMEKLQPEDIVLVADFWNPIINTIKFYSERKGYRNKFYAIHHGSSHIPGDFTRTLGYWTVMSEESWFYVYDKVFVGSNYIKYLLGERGILELAYLPIKSIQELIKELPNVDRIKNSILFPLRMEADKGVNYFFDFVRKNPDYQYFACTPTEPSEEISKICKELNIEVKSFKNRAELFAFERKMEYVFSFAPQETFGYGVLEALMNGCKPILRNAGVYKELYSKNNVLFDNIDEIDLDKVKDYDINTTLEIIGSPEEKIVKILVGENNE